MDKARVAIFEDRSEWREIYEGVLGDDAHVVVATATNLPDAETVIENLPEDGIDVALVDGNLTDRNHSGSDGAHIAALLREKFAEVTLISISGDEQVAGTDHHVSKIGDLNEINAIIASV